MVDAVVSVFLESVVSVLLEKSINVLADEAAIVIEFKSEFQKMKDRLEPMQSFLKDAERQKRRKESLRVIMDRLRELIYDSEDILADCKIRLQKAETAGGCSMCFTPADLQFYYQTGKRLREINQEIEKTENHIRTYVTPVVGMTTASQDRDEVQRWSSPVFDQDQIVGLEEETLKLKGWLSQDNEQLTAIGIVGMAGIGKTTAAQIVYSDRQVEAHFDRKMWVSVSQTFKEEEIKRSMLRHLGDVSVVDSPGELLRKIHQYLLGKRYLIVMDDVWSLQGGWWTRLFDGLPKGNRSRIIITTRVEETARRMGVVDERIHRPRLLTDEESWTLFCKIAFAGNERQRNDLEDVERGIVVKCGGLPLAIKAVGGILRFKNPSHDEWERIADKFSEELAEKDDTVKASLQLSYDELPPHLKSCFLCFSVYPEDCTILKDQLIRWWLGEGFVPMRGSRPAVELGEDYFAGLVNRCLVEAVDKCYNGKIITCKIHDMVRDLVIRTAKEEAFCRPDGVQSRRAGLKSSIDGEHLQSNSKLRAMLSTTKTGESNIFNSSIARKFCDCQRLRVLDVSRSVFERHLKDLFVRIGSLKHLAYLSLRHTHPVVQFPQSLEKLRNLQILDVSHCHNLRTLPPCITTLENLIILDASNCGSLKYFPRGLGKLSKLQVLNGFRPSRSDCSDGCRIAELRSLTQLKNLELRLTDGDEIGDDELDALSNLKQLRFLTIDCIDSYGNDLAQKLDKMSLPGQLYEISLKFFPGKLSPAWLNPTSLPKLEYLSISSGSIAHMNLRFWDTEHTCWSLQGLMLESLSDLEEEWTKVKQAMPFLRILSVCWCPKLDSFPVEDFGFRGGMWREVR